MPMAGLAAGVAAQQPQFRSGLTTVAVPVTVIDTYGFIVKTLEQDAFTLYDEGKVQTIDQLHDDDAPMNAVVLIDTSASMTAGLELATCTPPSSSCSGSGRATARRSAPSTRS